MVYDVVHALDVTVDPSRRCPPPDDSVHCLPIGRERYVLHQGGLSHSWTMSSRIPDVMYFPHGGRLPVVTVDMCRFNWGRSAPVDVSQMKPVFSQTPSTRVPSGKDEDGRLNARSRQNDAGHKLTLASGFIIFLAHMGTPPPDRDALCNVL